MSSSKKIALCLIILGLFSSVYFFRFWRSEKPVENKKEIVAKAKAQVISPQKNNMEKYAAIGQIKNNAAHKIKLTAREKYEIYLNKHPFNNRPHIYKKEGEEEDEEKHGDRPDLAAEQDFLRTMDPSLKRPTPEVLGNIINENLQLKNSQVRANVIPGTSTTPWVERGPNNVGGRTRALVWDPNDANGKKVWAGGVYGGLWFNNDITDPNSSWNIVDNFWSNLSVTCIAFDPNNSLIAYVGTGEGFGGNSGNSSGAIGAGIWKTVNGGTSWTQVSSTTAFSYTNDLVVRNESGTSVVYAAIDGRFYNGVFHNTQNAGLQRSTNGGTTWTQVLPSVPGTTINYTPASIAISANNRIWIGTKSSIFSATDRGGGCVLYSDNGTTWIQSNKAAVNNSSGSGRVTVACAPSDNNYVYSFIESSGKLFDIRKTIDAGNNWTSLSFPRDADNGIPASDFTRGQAGYDQVLKVDPNNAQTIIIGGIDLFRSTDTGTTWKQISKWSNNNALNGLKSSIVHADQHTMVFAKGSSTRAIFGNDGGVFYTTELQKADTSNVIPARNRNYNVTQFYSTAIHPSINTNYYLAGAQDNGTQLFRSAGVNSTIDVNGGDGGYCFIDQKNPNIQIVSYVFNQFSYSTDNLTTGGALLNDDSTGSFINIACYDNSLGILYTYIKPGSLYRVTLRTSKPNVTTINISGLASNATSLKVSPYTLDSTTLFIGTDAGRVLKVTKADTNPITTDVTGNLPVGSISNIEFGANENQLLVTFFNYGIRRVWYSSTGGNTWVDKSGDLPNMPVRWSLFNPNNRTDEVVLATELGIYGTTNFSNANPNWVLSNNGFANVRTDMLQMRNSDFQVAAATHGRGLYTSNAFVPSGALAPTIASFTPTSSLAGATITITGTNFTGATAVSFGGVNATSFNVVSPTSITAVVGSGKTGVLSVTTPGGIATTATNYTLASNLIPTITSFTPVNAASGASVAITGTNLSGATAVSFGGTAATSFNIVSSTTINAVVGAGSSGTVSVTTPAGTGNLAGFIFCGAAPTITNNRPLTFCVGDSTILTSSNASNNQWLLNGTIISGATSNTLAAKASGSYTVRTTGCTNSSTAIVVTANASPPQPTVSNSRPLAFCNGDSTVLTANTTTGLQWQLNSSNISGATSSTITVKSSGTYTVLTTNASNCTASSANIVVVNNPLPNKPTISWNSSQLSTASGLAGYQWILAGVDVTGATNNTHTPAAVGNYTVRVSTSSGCTAVSDPFSLVVTALTSVSISGTSVKVYPNPASTEAIISFDQTPTTNVQIKLINSNGTVVKSLLTKQKINRFSVFDLSKGTYYVEFTNGKQKGTIQLMIQ